VEKSEFSNVSSPSEVSKGPELKSDALDYLTLKVWKPIRWLIFADYGHIRIIDDHLVIKTTTMWSSRGWKIFFQIICYGFDLASILRFESTNQLRNLSAISVFKPNWIKWKIPFIIIRSPGFIGVFGVATETLDSVDSFVQATRVATIDVKYNLR